MTWSQKPSGHVKTKIVATVGPASENVDVLRGLIVAGVNVFRLNMAHGTPPWRTTILNRIRDTAGQLQASIGILADLSGPKIRLGPIPGGSLVCQPGAAVRFVRDAAMVQAASDLWCTYELLVDELKPDDVLLLSDGTVSMRVIEKAHDAASCRVEQGGEIRTGGGVNLPGVELSVDALTSKDRTDLEWALANGVDYVGLSFVRRAADVRMLRDELERSRSQARIVAKIEKPQAVEALDSIIAESDALMVARGDLGVEIDVARVPAVQKQIIQRCHDARVPVITATQMLESMRSSRLPTRAEATDVANAILDGSDAVMLSAETAMGQYPVETVTMMGRIALEAERLLEPRYGRGESRPASEPDADFTESLVEATARIAAQVHAKLIIVATRSGNTAQLLSKQRSSTPIIGVSDTEVAARRMALYWGVTPLVAPHFDESARFVDHVLRWAQSHKLAAAGDRVVVIASTHWTSSGHNMIGVHHVPA